jgi:hypothetical protein
MGGRIIVTAYAGLPSAKRAINEAGVDRYYPKPWNEGELLQAVHVILLRFVEQSGLEHVLVCQPADFQLRGDEILEIRREWWEYVSLMGATATERDAGSTGFQLKGDVHARHFIAYATSAGRQRAAGTLRMDALDGHEARLDHLSCLPEHANATTERLLLRTAITDAAQSGLGRIVVRAPSLRRELYEAIGFEEVGGAPGAPHVEMRIDLSRIARDAFAKRYRDDARVCVCAQRACEQHDFAAPRRSYFCALDVIEGRTPKGFVG